MSAFSIATVAELHSSEHISSDQIQERIFSWPQKILSYSINALEHVARIKIIKGHYLQAESETHVICAQELY